MVIEVDNKGVSIGGQRLIFDLYYFDSKLFVAPTLAGTFKKILNKWANVLQNSKPRNGKLFLPFALDDEWTDCLRADLIEDRVVLRRVRVVENGWAIDVDNIEDFMTTPHVVKMEDVNEFGNFEKAEFVSALFNAQVID